MAYLDYSLPAVPDPSEGIKQIGDALTDVMKRRQQREQFDREMQFKYADANRKYQQERDNIAYQNRIIDERNRRERIEFNAHQQERMAAAADKARHAASPQEAQAILHGAVMFDPQTGQEIGRGNLEPGPTRDIGPAPTAPTAPEFPREQAGAVIPDIVQAVPGMPPELAAMMRGKKQAAPAPAAAPPSELDALMERALPESSLDEAHRAELQSLQAGHEARKGKAFVDQIDEDGIATLLDENGNRQRVPATPDMQEGKWISPGGEETTRRFETSVQPSRFESDTRAEDAVAAYNKFQQDRKAYETDVGAFPGRQAAYAAEQRRADAERPYTIKFNANDPGATFDFKTQRTAAAEAAAQQFVDNLPPNMTPEQQDAAKQTYFALKSGADPQKTQAEFARTVRLGREQGFKHQEGLLRDEAALERAKIPKPGIMLAERRFSASQDKDIRKETRKDIQDWLKASGLETAPKQVASMDLSLKQLHGNGREVQAALVGMARATQGDNRFSDADYRVFVEKGGVGSLDQAANTIQKMIDGQFGDETIRVATQMATALRAVYDSRLRQAAEDGKQEFVHNEIYDPQVAESVLEQRLGKSYYQRESSRGGARGGEPPEVKARRRGKEGASLKVKANSVDDALKALQGMQ